MGRCLFVMLFLGFLGLVGCSDGLTPEELDRIGDAGMGGQAAGGSGGQGGIGGVGGTGAAGGGGGQAGTGGTPNGLLENQVSVATSLGTFVIELNFEAAPITARNFLDYVEAGFYDGSDGLGKTIFDYVEQGFVVAAGAQGENGMLKPAGAPIPLESNNGLLNLRGTVAMTRELNFPVSARSKFQVNVADNADVDYMDENQAGYVVFARVVSGMEVIDAIVATPANEMLRPLTPVTLDRVERWSP